MAKQNLIYVLGFNEMKNPASMVALGSYRNASTLSIILCSCILVLLNLRIKLRNVLAFQIWNSERSFKLAPISYSDKISVRNDQFVLLMSETLHFNYERRCYVCLVPRPHWCWDLFSLWLATGCLFKIYLPNWSHTWLINELDWS